MADTIEPADVYLRMEVALGEIELIRQEMGRPRDRKPDLDVSGAEPRETYFEVLAFFRKSDRLCFERTGEQAQLPHPPHPGEIQPMHVRAVADAAIVRLSQVKAKLGITEKTAEGTRDAKKTPSDVLRAAARGNRQLNLLLEQQFSPSDVYQLMTLAVGYASRISGKSLPLPAFERRKRPADCYRLIHTCFGKLKTVMSNAGLKTMDLGPPTIPDDDIQPSDVYDLASLLISELAYLHAKTPGVAPPSASDFYEAGGKLPSHVYQYAGLLDAQLAALANR